MARILILFAHPALEKSRIHRRLLGSIPALPGIALHDLYELYPDFDIEVTEEQELLVRHDLIIVQHPLFWYSTPPLLKQWEDLVLEHGWAYGSQGHALRGKQWLSLITTGGGASAYQQAGLNHYTMREFLAPLEQTARLCGMNYLPPYIIHGAHRLTDADIEAEAMRYGRLLTLLHNDQIDWSAADPYATLHTAAEARR